MTRLEINIEELTKEQQKHLLYQLQYLFSDLQIRTDSNTYVEIIGCLDPSTLKAINKLHTKIKMSKNVDEKEIDILPEDYLKQDEIEYISIKTNKVMHDFKILKKEKITLISDKISLLDNYFRELICYLFSPQEFDVSSFINREELVKTKYLENSFHHIMFASGLKKNHENLEQFEKKDKQESLLSYIEEPRYCLNPALCLHCYPKISEQIIKSKEVYSYTVFGKCYRDEGQNLNRTTRLQEFSMREYVVIGDGEIVQQQRNKSFAMLAVLSKILNSNFYFMTASDIFFDDFGREKAFVQLISANKIELRNNYDGEDYSIASINLHGNHFTSAYNIKMDSNRIPTSMCIGLGYERLIYLLDKI